MHGLCGGKYFVRFKAAGIVLSSFKKSIADISGASKRRHPTSSLWRFAPESLTLRGFFVPSGENVKKYLTA